MFRFQNSESSKFANFGLDQTLIAIMYNISSMWCARNPHLFRPLHKKPFKNSSILPNFTCMPAALSKNALKKESKVAWFHQSGFLRREKVKKHFHFTDETWIIGRFLQNTLLQKFDVVDDDHRGKNMVFRKLFCTSLQLMESYFVMDKQFSIDFCSSGRYRYCKLHFCSYFKQQHGKRVAEIYSTWIVFWTTCLSQKVELG